MPVSVIKLSQMHAHPLNRDIRQDSPEFKALVSNIQSRVDQGLEPLLNLPVVRPLKSGGWQIVCGHRRLAALKDLGIRTQKCSVREMTDQQCSDHMRLDNLHRADLTGAEVFDSVQQMHDEGLSNNQIAQVYGKSKQWVSNIRALRKLSPEVLGRAREGRVSVHALRKLLADSLKPVHAPVEKPLSGGVRVVRPWRLKTSGVNKLLQIELYSESAITVSQALKFVGVG